MKANKKQLAATVLDCAWAFKTNKEARAALAWIKANEPFIMSMGYGDGRELDEQCEGIDWTSGTLTLAKQGRFWVLKFTATEKELKACQSTLQTVAKEEKGRGTVSLWFSPCELEGFEETFAPATGKACHGECFVFGM